MNKFILGFGVGAIFLYGLFVFALTPYFALVFGDVNLYLHLKANPLTVDRCIELGADLYDHEKFRKCIDSEHGKVFAQLKKDSWF